jgi:CheY-like chemotaxis protein
MPSKYNLVNRVILVVNDDKKDAQAMGIGFQAAGFDNPVQAVYSGKEAIQYLKGQGAYTDRGEFPLPHIVLLDSEMPGMSGWELLEWIRQHDKFKTVPVILFGDTNNKGVQDTALALGASGYHAKPESLLEYTQTAKRIGEFWLGGSRPS